MLAILAKLGHRHLLTHVRDDGSIATTALPIEEVVENICPQKVTDTELGLARSHGNKQVLGRVQDVGGITSHRQDSSHEKQVQVLEVWFQLLGGSIGQLTKA